MIKRIVNFLIFIVCAIFGWIGAVFLGSWLKHLIEWHSIKL